MRRFLVILALLFSASCALADTGLVSLQSKYPVNATMDRLEAAVKASGGPRIFARIDLQEAALGKTRPCQLLIFGDGSLLPAFLASAPQSGIDLPLKIVVWEDASGTVWVSYNTGEYLLERHGVKNAHEAARRYTLAGERFAKMAAE
jgi:uncharacterized protein (DUF302 family)